MLTPIEKHFWKVTAVTSKLQNKWFFWFKINEGHKCMAFLSLDRVLQGRKQGIAWKKGTGLADYRQEAGPKLVREKL